MINRMDRLSWILILAFVTCASSALGEPENGALPELYITVQDSGQTISDLKAGNFQILEDRRPAAVESAVPAGPASVVLLVENSRASWTYLNEVNSAMRGFMKSAPSHHDYALVSYGRDTRVEATLSPDANQVAAAFAGRKASAKSYVSTNDAIVRVIDEMEKLDRWAVLVVIGSGEDSFSSETYQQLVRHVERSNVVVHTIQLGGSSNQQSALLPIITDAAEADRQFSSGSNEPTGIDLARGAMLLRAIAERSGGEYFCPPCEAGYRTAIEEILDSIDNTYRVKYHRAAGAEPGLAKYRVEVFRQDDDTRHDYPAKVRSARRF